MSEPPTHTNMLYIGFFLSANVQNLGLLKCVQSLPGELFFSCECFDGEEKKKEILKRRI